MLLWKKRNQPIENQKPANNQTSASNSFLAEQLKELANTSPNLAGYQEEDKNYLRSKSVIIVKTAKIVIVAVQLIFIAALALNFYAHTSIKILENDIAELKEDLERVKDDEEYAHGLIRGIDYYKELQASAVPNSPVAETIISNIPSSISINSLTIANKNVKLSLIASDPLSISFFINNLVSKNEISSVVLMSVSLNSADSSYNSLLEVNVK